MIHNFSYSEINSKYSSVYLQRNLQELKELKIVINYKLLAVWNFQTNNKLMKIKMIYTSMRKLISIKKRILC